MSVGENIRVRRQTLGLSQTELATAVGIRQPMIAQIERNTKNPSLQIGKEIARVLQCSMDDLVEEGGRSV